MKMREGRKGGAMYSICILCFCIFMKLSNFMRRYIFVKEEKDSRCK